jgi:hypothetical protein
MNRDQLEHVVRASAETLATRLAETSLDATGRRACDARLDRLRRGGR